jgi:hypothetical protein
MCTQFEYILQYHWAQALLQRAGDEGWLQRGGGGGGGGGGSAAGLMAKVSNIAQCGSTMHTYISSQLPYPYVQVRGGALHLPLSQLCYRESPRC